MLCQQIKKAEYIEIDNKGLAGYFRLFCEKRHVLLETVKETVTHGPSKKSNKVKDQKWNIFLQRLVLKESRIWLA